MARITKRDIIAAMGLSGNGVTISNCRGNVRIKFFPPASDQIALPAECPCQVDVSRIAKGGICVSGEVESVAGYLSLS